jgi:hypothetical protein
MAEKNTLGNLMMPLLREPVIDSDTTSRLAAASGGVQSFSNSSGGNFGTDSIGRRFRHPKL